VDRIVPKEFFKGPLIRAWRPMHAVTFQVIGENMFIAEFEWDKSRIMEGRPWLFDGNLVSLAEFDGITPPAEMHLNMHLSGRKCIICHLLAWAKTLGRR